MSTKQKVMVFIARPKAGSYEWLTRRNAPSPEHGGDRWYVVTGNVEASEMLEASAAREVREETGISSSVEIIKLPFTNSYTSYKDPDIRIEEQAFVLVTNYNDAINLNEESIDYQWLPLEDFVNKIWWPKDRNQLQNILLQAIREKK